MENNIIYTCVTGGYDVVHPINAPCRALLFTDKNIKVRGWETVLIPTAPKVHRAIKIMPFQFLPSHDKSVWIDGNLQYHGDWNRLLDKNGYWAMQHPERSDIITEGAKIIELGKDSRESVEKALKRYKNADLVATGVLIRENTVKNTAFGLEWWREVAIYSHRDQLSFCWVAKKLQLKYNLFPFLEGFHKNRHALGYNKPVYQG